MHILYKNIKPLYAVFLQKEAFMENKTQKINWPAGALLAPVPAVLVSCGPLEKPNAFTVAWTGIICSTPAMTYISVRPERYSYELISQSSVFCINLVTKDMVRAVDFCGVRSGRDMDKLKLTGLHTEKAASIECPSITESPVNIECRVKKIEKLGTHDMFIADIVSVSVDEKYIDKAGKLHMDKMNLIAYSHGEYFELGPKLGSFGYTVKKK